MGLQRMGKEPELRRLAGRVASRSTSRWSWLRTSMGFCLLAVVVGGPTVGLPHTQVAAAINRLAARAADIPQTITFNQPPDTTVGRPITLTASSVTTTPPSAGTGLTVSFGSNTPATCTVSGFIATPTAAGFCAITATQSGDGTFAPAPDVARAFRARAGSEPQTIIFDQPTAAAVGQPVVLTAVSVTTTTSPAKQTGLTVSFRSDTPDACTVSGSTVTPATADVCTITASQGGSDRYAAAQPVQRSFRAHTGTSQQTINFEQPQDAFLGQPVTLSASTDAREPLPVSFRSDSPLVCTVLGLTVTPITVGTCTVTAFQGGSAAYAAAQASKSFPVMAHGKRAPQQISFDKVPGATVGVPVVLMASSSTLMYEASTSPKGLTVSFSSRNQQVCTVSGATVVPWTVGLCVITASQEGNARYQPAKPVTQEFPVARAVQIISFTPSASATIGQSVILTATASSWLPVTYTSSSPDVCTVSGATVTATVAGTCIITASQPGNDQYAPADPMTRSFPVQKIPQTISFTPPKNATAGQPVPLTASATSKLAVSLASDTPDVCTVSGSTATTSRAGTCSVTASQPGNDQYAPADPVTRSFPVQKIPQMIDFPQPPDVAFGRPVTLTATASSRLPVSYSTSTPDVCTLSGRTVTTTTAAGACAITASQAGDARYAPARDLVRSFRIKRAAQTITFTPPDRTTIGQSVTLTASATSKLAVSFASDTPDVCTVSGSTATTSRGGTCSVTASQVGDDRYAAAEPVRRSFQVARIPQMIDFPQPPDVAFGRPVTLTATASSRLPVRYSTSTPDVCTLSGSTLTPGKAGTCTITASQPGDDQYAPADAVTRSFPVNRGIVPPEKTAQGITFGQPPTVAVGQPVSLAASSSSGLAVSFRSDTPSVCTVSSATVTTTRVGTCTVTASQVGDNRFAPARDVKRSFAVHAGPPPLKPNKASQAITFGQPPTAAVGQVVPLTAGTTSGLAVSFRSDTPSVCTVSSATVTTTRAGPCTVTASQAGDDRYLPAREVAESFQVHAGHQAQTITFARPPEAKVGETVTLSASATSGLAVAFRSDTPRTCTVSGTNLTPTASGTCTVTVSQGGNDRYAAAPQVEQSIDVASANSIFPGILTILVAAAVSAAAGVTTLVRRVRRRSRRLRGPQPSLRAAPVPGPPALVSVKKTGAGVTHTVHIGSSPGASITTIKEARP